jgi:MraZ protein
MDKSGRILIPTLLRESARMTGEVAVLGYLSNLEIWNQERFLSTLKEKEFTEADNEILGQLGI